VLATTDEKSFELAVANQGEPIDPAVTRQLFQPFFRGRSSNQGLGLGLYIAFEIARAHGGQTEVFLLGRRDSIYPAHSPHLLSKP
jgi:signal transduction histidine kinase